MSRLVLLHGLIVALFLFCLGAPDVKAQSVAATPIDRPLPTYPEAADVAEGTVKLHFRIGIDGRIADVAVLESMPQGLFDAAALAAVRQWRYNPRTENGTPVEQTDNNILLKFKPPTPNETPEIIRKQVAYYPRSAFDQGIEGDVTVRFDVSPIGLAEHAMVVQSTVPTVFDEAALRSLKTMRFRVTTIDGQPRPAPGLQMTIPFRLANARLAPVTVSHGELIYPLKALNAGLQGYCMTHFQIREDGSVDQIEILYTYPGDAFRESCLAYVQTLKYASPDSDPRGHSVHDHSIRINFVLSGPGTPKSDLKPGEWVRIQYTATAEGRVKDVKVIQTSGPDVLTEAALEQVRGRRLKPFIENGVAIDRPNQLIVVTGPED